MKKVWWLLLLAALLAAPSLGAPGGPLLLVLCEHFDLAVPYRLEAGGLSPAAPPTAVSAPHDGAWSAAERMLYMTADYKGQPCVIPFRVGSDGALARSWDPIPTRGRQMRLLLLGVERRFLLAWSAQHAQVLPIDADSALPLPPVASTAGFDAVVPLDRTRLLTLRGTRLQPFALDGQGTLRPLGRALDAGYGACALALDPSGHTLCVLTLDQFDRHLRFFDVGPDGVPVPSPAPRPRTPQEAQKRIAMAGSALYVVNPANTISVYARQDGAWSILGRPVPTSDGFDDMIFVDGHAFTVGANEPAVRVYRVQRDGRLRAGRPQPLPSAAAGTRLLLLQ